MGIAIDGEKANKTGFIGVKNPKSARRRKKKKRQRVIHRNDIFAAASEAVAADSKGCPFNGSSPWLTASTKRCI